MASIKIFFSRFFSRDPEEAKRRAELKRIYARLAELHPVYYRPKQNLVVQGFAQAVYAFATSLRPLAEVARATVAASDSRVSQRYFDYLVECRLPPDKQEKIVAFSYDGMCERIGASLDPEFEIQVLSEEFQVFLREIEALGNREVNADLNEVDRFIEICRFDYERLLGLFDPGITLDSASYRPDFGPVEGEQAYPEIVDLYFLVEGFLFDSPLKANFLRLLERRSPSGIDEAKRKKIDKLFSHLDRLLQAPLNTEILLALMRATKGEPKLAPKVERERRDFLDSYKRRLKQQFERDRERIQRERHESAIATDIKALFGTIEILELEGYDDETDSFVRRESPNGFAWIKPMRILKTFISALFEPSLKESIKRILVEGYFDNKNFQNNLANILYQCERSLARIDAFEEQMMGNGRISIVAVKRYVEEMRRGKDIISYLNRLVDAINDKAKEIVEDEAGLFAMLGDAVTELLSDSKKPSPELITNIRTLGGGRNREILAQIQAGRDRIACLIKIMRSFTVVRPTIAGELMAEEQPLEAATSPESAVSESLESLDEGEIKGLP